MADREPDVAAADRGKPGWRVDWIAATASAITDSASSW